MTRLSSDELVAIRRDLHRHPELSHQEQRTAGVVAEQLRALGLQPKTGVAGHGVVAVVEGAHPGPTLLYRADMDALPIQEENQHGFESCRPGVMHACGHDVHTTVGIGVAHAIVEARERLHGRVKFVFQPAEEAAPPPGRVIGAELMVAEGTLEAPAVDAAFALHVMPQLDHGQLGFTGGSVWAASDLFDIHVRGRMSHGAYPHEGADPIVAGAAIISALQSLVARRVDARDPTVISVCRFSAGTAYNIVPDTAHLQGLIRTLDERVRVAVLKLLVETVEHVALAHGCSAEVETVRGAWLTANHPLLERFVCERIAERPDGPRLVSFKPQMGAEDFSAFSRRVPSCFLFLGVRNEAKGIVHMIHTPRFDVDERCLALAVDAMTHALLETGARWAEVAPSLGRGA